MESRIESGTYVRPCDGETLSGDVVFVQPQGEGVFAVVIDALGHGPEAHRARRPAHRRPVRVVTGRSASSTRGRALRSYMKALAAREAPQQRWRG